MTNGMSRQGRLLESRIMEALQGAMTEITRFGGGEADLTSITRLLHQLACRAGAWKILY